MKINLKFMEIEFSLKLMLSRKQKILKELKINGRIHAVKLYKELYGSSLQEAVYQINEWMGVPKGKSFTDYFDSKGNQRKYKK